MRRTLGALLCLLLLLGPAAAEEKPRQPAKPLTPEQAADAVLEAVKAKTEKVLGRLAKEDNPDPWMVVEELCDRGEHDGAEAFARAAPRKAVEKLPAYIGSRRGKAPDGTARDTLAVMLDATARGEWPRVFDAADGAPKRLDTVVGLRIAFGRGMALRFLSRLSESTKALTEVGEAARALGWLGYASAAFLQAGQSAGTNADWERALAIWTSKVPIDRALGHKRGIAQALHSIAFVQVRRGNYGEALKRYAESLKLKRDLGNKTDIARTLSNIGGVHHSLGNYDEALKRYAESLELMRAVGVKRGIASLLNNLGAIHAGLGNHDEALRHYEESLGISRAAGDQLAIAQTITNVGSIQNRLGDYDKALTSHAESLEIRRALGNKRGIAETLANIGVLQDSLGDPDEALRCFEESLALNRALGDKAGIASALRNIGSSQSSLGNHDEALRRLAESLAINRAMGSKPGIAQALDSIGVVQMGLGDYDEALRLLAESLAIRRALGDRGGTASVLQNIGVAQERLGNHNGALRRYRESLEFSRALGNKPDVASMLINVGVVHAALGDYDEARASYEQALRLLEESPNRRTQSRVAWGIAALHLREGRDVEAVDWALKCLAHVALLFEGLAEGEGAGAREWYSTLFDVAYRAALRAGDVPRLGLIVEHGRGSSLRESLGSRRALEAAVIPVDLRKKLVGARHAERRALAAYKQARTSGRRSASRQARTAWTDAQADVSRVAKSIEREAKHAAAVALSEPDDLQTIQGYIAPTEALVYYILTSEVGLALVVRRDKVRAVALPRSTEIAAAAEALLDGDLHVDPAHAPALRGLLVDPLNLGTDVKRVLVSPMGPLGYVPFSLLFPNHEVVYVPSGTTYGLLLEERAKRGDGILGLGDPDYQVRRDESIPTVRGGSVTQLPRLPATKMEVEAIADVRLLDKQATETGLRDAVKARERWRAVHLACHGLVDPDRPMLSSLAVTADKEHNGFLTALEIFRMQIPADLVVMSACETGKGQVYMTEGIVGLTRAFMFAGAPRVICSLWKVDDEATQALMIKFYELWSPKDGSKGLGAAAALKQAQEHVRSQGKWRHPYYWAAWVLWGLAD